ncbi:MAG TPA: HipA family kinase [Puia sp.]|nr:HipA family kinase [Puia sp.]
MPPFTAPLFAGNRDSVANEVLGHVLAKAFGLPVPDAALIELDASIVSNLSDPSLEEILRRADARPKFATVMMEGYMRFDPELTSVDVRKIIDFDSVFAFDNLIRNPDRNAIKPNMLSRSHDTCLIDHELGFEVDTNTAAQFLRGEWADRYYRWHIFYEYLRNSRQKSKDEYFHEFEEYLKFLNINELHPYLQQIANYGYPTAKHGLVLDYLELVKKNWSTFVKMIRGLVE